jgi:peptidoglycan/xylan/chitin deacetylase (PgdA/CDA1 family)
MPPPLLTGGARRRRPWLRLALVLLPLLIAVGGAAVVAEATQTTHPAPKRRPPSPDRDPVPRVSLAVRENRAIDRILGYTPFVTAGIPRRKLIALTFDDGPSPYTPQIVRELLRLHVTATFFVVGQQLDYFGSALREEARDGFAIGDHTENHPPLAARTARSQYLQIHTDALRIHHFTGAWPRLFRPPYGVWNQETMTILHRLHMLMVMWSDDPADWSRPGTRIIIQRVLARARPGEIIELHDGGGDRSQTAAALPKIISELRRRHYEFVTVPQLLMTDPPPRHQRLRHLTE